jgi:hypothetical protein
MRIDGKSNHKFEVFKRIGEADTGTRWESGFTMFFSYRLTCHQLQERSI